MMKYFNMMCKAYSMLFCFAQTYLLLFPMFAFAFFSNTMECLLRINIYGEANVEMVFWLVSFPFIIYGVFLNMRDAFRSK